MRAITLLSGGLDSTLAARVMMEQGIEVEVVNFLMPFHMRSLRAGTVSPSEKAAKALNIPLKVFDVSDESLSLMKYPKHGYGKNINPCIDCKIFMLKRTKTYMEESGASFVVTGEVLGQRPMSQRRDTLRIIEKESGLEGLLLRPLSAKVLPVTVPEKEGWVDRKKLLDFSGRSRKPQMALAEHYGLRDYPNPAGGCLLTDPGFTQKVKDLMIHLPDFSVNDIQLLKLGRHFRLSQKVKLVVGRNEEENQGIRELAQGKDILLKVSGFPSSLSLLRGEQGEEDIEKAAAIAAHYSKAKNLEEVEVTCQFADEDSLHPLRVSPLSRGEIEIWMINE